MTRCLRVSYTIRSIQISSRPENGHEIYAKALNQTRESERDHRRGLLRDLFGAGGDTVCMQQPFYCDYGSNIYLGTQVFLTSTA